MRTPAWFFWIVAPQGGGAGELAGLTLERSIFGISEVFAIGAVSSTGAAAVVLLRLGFGTITLDEATLTLPRPFTTVVAAVVSAASPFGGLGPRPGIAIGRGWAMAFFKEGELIIPDEDVALEPTDAESLL